jgi:inosine/xanthosine triphosphate pyrophosphatase family protein
MLSPLGIEGADSERRLGISKQKNRIYFVPENALAKARHVKPESGLPALADDSDVCNVRKRHHLGGFPVWSACYADV